MRPALFIVYLGLASVLVACDAAPDEDLQQWMLAQKAQTKPRIKPISEPKQFTPESYAVENEVEPFGNQKLALALKQDVSQVAAKGGLVGRELARPKEPLEAFPLDAMSLVGSLVRGDKPVALVKIGGLLHQVRPGDYLGQNYGLVTKIIETEVSLREIVQDATGEWIERAASLQLQQGSK